MQRSGGRELRWWLIDMDGVLVHEEHPIEGAERFLATLAEHGAPFLVLTNNSIYTPRDLSARLAKGGLHVPEASIWTSALATAAFLDVQRPGGLEAGLHTVLVLSGVSTEADVERFPYRPSRIVPSVATLADDLAA